MSDLYPCPGCQRHVRQSETHCPFCGEAVSLGHLPAHRVPRQRMNRAATFAFGASVVGATLVVNCSDGSGNLGHGMAVYGAPPAGGTASGGTASGGTAGNTGTAGTAGNAGSGGAPAAGTAGTSNDVGGAVAVYGAPAVGGTASGGAAGNAGTAGTGEVAGGAGGEGGVGGVGGLTTIYGGPPAGSSNQ